MKRMLDVEKTRRSYHADRAMNSTHRASLMVPEFDGADAEISFLNHFLLKRGYPNVACRVTAIDPEGARIVSRLVPINEPKVYTIPLSGMVDEVVDSYQVEFFAADNLFIPFPAVMINHRGDGFVNSVHAYNRVLNDVFEDDEINQVHQREAAIDVRYDDVAETFLVFHAGPQPVDDVLRAELTLPDGRVLNAEHSIRCPKLCRKIIMLSDLFPELPKPLGGGTLKVDQPRQFLFYGRMLVGQKTADGAFSANHSYYDCADFPEYWDNSEPSGRVYPFLPKFDNILRFYPIMSPGDLSFNVSLFDPDGRELGARNLGQISTPKGNDLEFSVTDFVAQAGIDPGTVSGFGITARPSSGNTPTRVNHQLVYGAGGLESSINISLTNPNVFVPAGKKGFSWGQVLVGGGMTSQLGLVGMTPSAPGASASVKFYDARGQIAERQVELANRGAAVFDVAEELESELDSSRLEEGDCVWYQVATDRPDPSAIVASRNDVTGHSVGEHSF
ncbi:MAG: hypothetical protein R8L07_12500 [Alphaproteobacteria bacterium]|nr:hypothetical protein [Alphaproteobacteria bacterium]